LPNFDRMPNLFLIGAAKAGTTALYDYLAQHPQVFLSRIKEPMFFSRDEYYARGLD
jgi:Sulfotransferase family